MGREPSCSVRAEGGYAGAGLWALTRRKGTNVAAVALANKTARVIWALLAQMMCIDNPPRCRQGANRSSRGETSRITERFTPRSAARSIRDDTRGRPGAFKPWTNYRPERGRCASKK